MNLDQKTKRVPSEKHFWVDKLINAKRNKDVLLKQKKKLKDKVIKGIMDGSPVTLDKKTLDNIDNTPELEDINDKLKDSEYLIEYLDHVVKIFSFLDNSIKNIIECEKLQQL